jgi:hypothetical protein
MAGHPVKIPVLIKPPPAGQNVAAAGQPPDEAGLRALAAERIYRIRRFKLHLAAFAVGVPLRSALTE